MNPRQPKSNPPAAPAPTPEDLEQRYLESGGIRCPYCGSEDLSVRSSDGAGVVTSRVVCETCWKKWFEHRKLIGFGPVEEGA
jgi:hypothetical protein